MTETQITAQKPQETNPMGGGIPASSKRVEWIDITKGITIILVVIFHCSPQQSWFNQISVSFMMPLFFMLSGMCFNDKRYPQFWEYFKRKTRFLLWPMYALSFIYVVLCNTLGVHNYDLVEFFSGNPVGVMWFVWVLYLVELALYPLCKMFSRRYLIIPLLVSLVAGILLDKYQIENVRFICTFFSALFFYGIGFYIKDIIKKGVESKWCCLLYLAAVIQGFFHESHIDMRSNEIYEGFYHTVPVAIMSSIGVMAICRHYVQYWDKIKRPLVWCGKNSFVILAFHMLGARMGKFVYPYLIGHFPAFHITQQVIIWSVCISFALLINRYAKWILGK